MKVEDRWGLRTCLPSWQRTTRPKAGGPTLAGPDGGHGLDRRGAMVFEVHSKVRPWAGTFADVDRGARTLAASLRARGPRAGRHRGVQLPKLGRAGVTFWAAAYLGAVVVPIVHSYGPKRSSTSLRVTSPDLVVTADRFGHGDYWRRIPNCWPSGRSRCGWWSATPRAPTCRPRRRPSRTCWRLTRSPGRPRSIPTPRPSSAFTSGTTRDPKGVSIHIAPSARRPASWTTCFPRAGPRRSPAHRSGHFIGMLNAFLIPLYRERPVHLLDVWDPGVVLRMMREEGLGIGGGATYFLTSLLDHPDFLGRSPGPAAVRRPRWIRPCGKR